MIDLDKVRHPGRGRKRNIVAYILFGFIALTFVFFGFSPSDYGVLNGGAAAVVNNEVISLKQYQNRLRMVERQMTQLSGMPEAQKKFYRQLARSRALDDLIQFELMYQKTQDEGIRISDKEIMQRIVDTKDFHEDGIFSHQRYKALLNASGMEPSYYEQILGRELAIGHLRNLFLNSLTSSKIESEKDYLAQETKLKVSYLKLNEAELAKKVKISAADVTQFQADKKNEIESYYNRNKADYTTEAKATASHILIKAKKGDKKSEDAALEKIKKIKAEANKKNFGDLAKKHSEDPGSKNKKGSLGSFGKGKMVKEFETAAFTQEVGTISEPIKTDFGYHLIFVEKRTEEKTSPLAEVEKGIAKKLLSEEGVVASIKALDEGEVTAEMAKTTAKKYGIKWETTDEFNLAEKAIPGIGESNEVFSAVLSLKEKDQIHKKLIRVGSDSYIVKLASMKQPKPYTDNKKDAPVDNLVANEVFYNWVQSLKKSAKIERNEQLIQVN